MAKACLLLGVACCVLSWFARLGGQQCEPSGSSEELCKQLMDDFLTG
jgi:hypothetical protein